MQHPDFLGNLALLTEAVQPRPLFPVARVTRALAQALLRFKCPLQGCQNWDEGRKTRNDRRPGTMPWGLVLSVSHGGVQG